MEFSLPRSRILTELDLAENVVEKKNTIPILSNLLLETAGSELHLSATDLQLGLRCGIKASVSEDGAAAVPARRLLEIARSLPEAEVKFKLLENQWIHITCQRASFKLVGMARDNYPALPERPQQLAAIPVGTLRTMIQRTNFAIANEETRYTLNGALLLLKPEKVTMVATDGHRLAHVERDVTVTGLNNELRTLIPKKAMGEILRLLGQSEDEALVGFSKDENHLFFSVGDRLLISRGLTGQFPNYDAVLPRENNIALVLEKDRLAGAVRRVALLADERSRAIRIQIEDGQMNLTSSSGDYGEAQEALDTEYQGEKMQVGFNYQYLIDFFAAVGDGKIRIELKDEQSAGQFRPVEDGPYRYRYVVMPMRV